MVLIISRVQRCCVSGAPNGYYKVGEQFDAPEDLAKQLVDANVCQYALPSTVQVPPAPPNQTKTEEVENVDQSMPTETQEVTEPEPKGKKGKK